MSTIKCPKCKKKISDETNKCIYCGCEFEKAKRYYCDKCGSTVDIDDKRCSNCRAILYTKNTVVCENCGKVIKKSKKCPYCGFKNISNIRYALSLLLFISVTIFVLFFIIVILIYMVSGGISIY